MLSYYGYTAVIWLIALWVTGKHTFVLSLFEDRMDKYLDKIMACLLLFIVWSFSVLFLPWFIWHHVQKYRDEVRWEKMAKEDVKKMDKESETEFDGCWGDDL